MQDNVVHDGGSDMPVGRMNAVLRNLHAAAFAHGAGGVTDEHLLQRYVADRDEVAFEGLLRRHGPMVLGVCRRVLRNDADAEDAFQATFLVLVRKAAAVRPRGLVGNWLYGVAYRTSMKARAMNAKRRSKEKSAGRPARATDLAPCDLQAVIDQEVSRLPDKYRATLVLCDIEGKTRAEAARQIGCPDGTVATRLVKARTLLARSLTRRGVTLSAGGVAVVLGQRASAQVPASLLEITMKAATSFAAGPAAAAGVIPATVVALTEGVLQTMSRNQIRTLAVLLLTAGALAGGTFFLSASPQTQQIQEAVETRLQQQRDAGAKGFLVTGKEYEFVLAASRTGFVGKVLATRGEQWVHVNIQDGSPFAAGPTWVNLNHVLLVGDATTTVIRGRLLEKREAQKK
jgi:RNA polymerase sigma factor (sigma-70 family)